MATVEWSTGAGGFETTPAGNTSRKLGDDRIRELKIAMRERMQQGGHFMADSGAGFPRDGRHVVDAGGAGISPALFKSDGTTKLIDYTNTEMQLKAGMNITSVDGINYTALKQLTKTFHTSSSASDTVAAAGGIKDYEFSPSVLGTPKGTVMLHCGVELEAVVAANKKTDVSLAIDYTGGGTYATPATYQVATNLYVPFSAANESRIIVPLFTIDPMTTSTDGGTWKFRVRITNNDVTAGHDVIVRAYWADAVEFRR